MTIKQITKKLASLEKEIQLLLLEQEEIVAQIGKKEYLKEIDKRLDDINYYRRLIDKK